MEKKYINVVIWLCVSVKMQFCLHVYKTHVIYVRVVNRILVTCYNHHLSLNKKQKTGGLQCLKYGYLNRGALKSKTFKLF